MVILTTTAQTTRTAGVVADALIGFVAYFGSRGVAFQDHNILDTGDARHVTITARLPVGVTPAEFRNEFALSVNGGVL